MKGSMIFCQKNILEHSMSFFGEDDFAIFVRLPILMRTMFSEMLLFNDDLSGIARLLYSTEKSRV